MFSTGTVALDPATSSQSHPFAASRGSFLFPFYKRKGGFIRHVAYCSLLEQAAESGCSCVGGKGLPYLIEAWFYWRVSSSSAL